MNNYTERLLSNRQKVERSVAICAKIDIQRAYTAHKIEELYSRMDRLQQKIAESATLFK